MLEKRSSVEMGTSSFKGAHSIHHFCYGRYQSADRLNWGNLRVLNRVRLEPGAARTPNFLGGMEVIILAEAGEIEIQCGDRKSRLANDGGSVLKMGIGAEYGISNVRSAAAAFIEIWFNMREGALVSSNAEVRDLRRRASISTFQSRSDLMASTPQSLARTSILALADSEIFNWRVNGPEAYITVLTGVALIGGIWCKTGDAIAIRDETEIAILANGPSQMLAMDMPGAARAVINPDSTHAPVIPAYGPSVMVNYPVAHLRKH